MAATETSASVHRPGVYTLYGFKGSGSAAVEVALRQCSVSYRTIDAASWEPGSAVQQLERLNPLKQIPTLVTPEGGVLTESAAILIELGLAYPEAGILPSEPSRRAQSVRGLVYVAANCYSAIGIIDYPERACADADSALKERIRTSVRKRLHQHWEQFADQFPAQPYLSGAAPGGLDFLAAVVSRWSGARAYIRDARPHFLATLEQIEHHPGVAAVFRRHWDT
jgi:GST-like protein